METIDYRKIDKNTKPIIINSHITIEYIFMSCYECELYKKGCIEIGNSLGCSEYKYKIKKIKYLLGKIK